jgi:magnesium chelatase family protein
VLVEVDVRSGLPGFTIVGLADAAVREARERIRAAIRNSGREFPAKRITANLAPGDVRKAGAGLDLAIAGAILAASEQLPGERLERLALVGELGLDGTLRRSHGTLAVAQAARQRGLRGIVVAPACSHEAALVDGLTVLPASSLTSAIRILCGGESDPMPPRAAPPAGRDSTADLDLADVSGQRHAVEALMIAAAGGHNMLMRGPPGCGKTMLALRLASILPPLAREEAIEVMRLRSVAGLALDQLPQARPFRAPHHTVGTGGLIGGGARGTVGEVVLAHHGTLFLDEIAEFAREPLEALREPLEQGSVAVSSRSGHVVRYPSRFMLLAATNPCPCGYADEEEPCGCSRTELLRYRRRLSGPLLDRLDLIVRLGAGAGAREGPALSSRQVLTRVMAARERQAKRLIGEDVALNAHMSVGILQRHLRLSTDGERALDELRERWALGARAEHRLLCVARTIADLSGSDRVRARHLVTALTLREGGGREERPV